MNSTRHIGIYGSSSGRNAGDAALIGAIMDGLDQAFGARQVYEIPTYRPTYIWREYLNKTHPVSMLPWHGSVGMFGPAAVSSFRRCELNLIYDNMLFDKRLWDQLFNYMPAVWAYFTKLRRKGQFLGMYNAGTGPVNTKTGREMLRAIGEACDIITVRDTDSKQLLKDVGVRHDRILVTADAAVGLAPAPEARAKEIFSSLGIGDEEPSLGLNVNCYVGSWSGSTKQLTEDEFVGEYAKAAERLYRELKVPLVFVITQPRDLPITRRVMERLSSETRAVLLSNESYNHAEMKAALGRLSFLFAMRLHANILATSMCTPAVALSFQKKVTSYFTEIGLPENILSFDRFSAEELYQHAMRGWERRGEMRSVLEKRMPQLQKKALVAAEVFKTLCETKSRDTALRAGSDLLLNLNAGAE